MSFKLKLFFAFILFGIFLSFFSIYSFSNIAKERELEQKIDLFSDLIKRKEDQISAYVEQIGNHLYSISNNKMFKDYLKTSTNSFEVEELFKSITMSNSSIYQARYIDNSGQEKVRVNNLNGKITVTAKKDLQNKANRYYFNEIKQQPKGYIWYSKMDLNIEDGKIERPIKPVFRVGVNLDSGILILNISLDYIQSILKKSKYRFCLVDKDGEVLIDSTDKRSWSRYLDKNFDIKKTLEQDNIMFLSSKYFLSNKFISMKLRITTADEPVLILRYPDDFISKINEDMFYTYITIFLSTVLVAIILAYLFSRPISRLTVKIERLNDKLDKKVEKRTRELKNSLDIIDKYVIRSTTDTNGIIISVSEAFCKISGYTKEELLGQSHSIVKHPDTPKELFKQMWLKISSGKTWDGKIKNLNKQGEFYWVNAHIEPNFNKNGEIVSYTAIRNDITSKVLLESQIEENNAIIKHASSGIGTIDLEGNFLTVNDEYSKLFGYKREELIGRNCLSMTTEEYRESSIQALKIAYEIGSLSRLEKVCVDKFNNEISIEMSLNLLPDRNSFVVVINSLEDRKKLESLNQSLEQRIKDEVKKSTEQLEFIQQEQLRNTKLSSIGALAAGITHEINTPLTYIKGNFEMLKYDIQALQNEESKNRMIEDIEIIQEGINRIATIVESMKEVSQTSSELMEETNIYSTLITALTVSYNSAKHKAKIYVNDEKFDIEMPKDRYIFNSNVQKQRVEQVWIVIINNALDELIQIDDYENRRLDIIITQTDEKEIIVKFKDNAGGIKEDVLEKIFEPFVSTKVHGGMGIGLNIAKKIVTDQGGDMIAYNEDNGAVFEVKFKSIS